MTAFAIVLTLFVGSFLAFACIAANTLRKSRNGEER